MKILPDLQACRRYPVDHCPIPKHRQIEAVAIERYKLGAQLPDLLDEIAYQLGLGTLTDVGCPERINTPAFGLTAGNQSANANDFMKRMLSVRPESS
jgi:hypothetical protein